jgi:hypothetical protein
VRQSQGCEPFRETTAMTERELLLAALDIEPDQSSTYLDAACGGDAALRHRVERLLQAHPQAGSFLDRPAEEREGNVPTGGSDAPAAGRPPGPPGPSGRGSRCTPAGAPTPPCAPFPASGRAARPSAASVSTPADRSRFTSHNASKARSLYQAPAGTPSHQPEPPEALRSYFFLRAFGVVNSVGIGSSRRLRE